MTSDRSSGTAPQPVPDESGYVRACSLADLPEGGTLGVEIEGAPVALVRTGGEVFALRDVCSHAEVALSEGEIYDHTLECWLHGSCFDVRTGEPTGPPATEPVDTYPVRVEGEDVYVAVGQGDASGRDGSGDG